MFLQQRRNEPVSPGAPAIDFRQEQQKDSSAFSRFTDLVKHGFQTTPPRNRNIAQQAEEISPPSTPNVISTLGVPLSPTKFVLPPAHVQVQQLAATDKSLDGRLATMKDADDSLAVLVGSRRVQRGPSRAVRQLDFT